MNFGMLDKIKQDIQLKKKKGLVDMILDVFPGSKIINEPIIRTCQSTGIKYCNQQIYSEKMFLKRIPSLPEKCVGCNEDDCLFNDCISCKNYKCNYRVFQPKRCLITGKLLQ